MINSFAASGGERLLFTIFVMFVAAKLAAEIFERLKQPAVAGEILAGVVIGPSVLGLVAPSELTEALSEIGGWLASSGFEDRVTLALLTVP